MSILQHWRRYALGAAFTVAATFGPLAGQAAAATVQPTRFLGDVHVVSADNPDVSCPSGYDKNPQDLNQGSRGKYVFACLSYTNVPSKAIQEVYIAYYFPGYSGASGDGSGDPHCNSGSDIVVDGDLNEGTSNSLTHHEGLNFCEHFDGTPGGSGAIANPGAGHTDFFAAREGKVMTDMSFLKFDSGNLPTCNNNACVDTGVNGLAYLEVGKTIDPYCQSQFGPDWHPIFRTWHYAQTNDQNADTPQDAEVMNLNAGDLSAPLIYACGHFQSVSPLVATATTQPDNQPYTPGTWANQRVDVIFTCFGLGEPTPVSGFAFNVGANQFSDSGTGCVDRLNQTAKPLSFGPVNIDMTPPTVSMSNSASTYALDQTVSIDCTASDADSGIKSSTCAPIRQEAYTFGIGNHVVTATVTDQAGNVTTATVSFTVQATFASLKAIDAQLLGTSNPSDVKVLATYLDAAQADPTRFATQTDQYRAYLSAQAGDGSLSGQPQRTQAKLLTDLSRGLPAPAQTLNDSDASIHYTGSGWNYYTNRGVGDIANDVHATTHDGDYAALTFDGTGIDFITERSADEGGVDVAIDGVLQQTVNAQSNAQNQANQTLYSLAGLPRGSHTITLTKRGGAYMLLDGLRVQTSGQTVNDTDTGLQFGGSGWSYFNGRPASVGDVQQDVHATPTNGDWVAYTFIGTGVGFVTEKSSDEGQVDVYLDGALQQTVDAGAAGVHNQGGQVLFSATGLPASQHTIKLVKKSGGYMLLDALTVQP